MSQSTVPTMKDPFDITSLPDHDTNFINQADLDEFEKALNAPEASPVTALNDWRPIRQKVRKAPSRRKTPKRSTDETREGFVYQLLKWPFLVGVFAWIIGLAIAYVFTRLYIWLYEQFVTWTGRRQSLRKKLHETRTYEEWVGAAKDLDNYLGNDKWRENEQYAYYDHATILKVTQQLRQLRDQVEAENEKGPSGIGGLRPIDELNTLLEACVKNNFVGIENSRLYSESYFGTKDAVQDFIDEAEAALKCSLESTQVTQEEKWRRFKHFDTNFGRTALCLSGGATFAYYHFGVVKALLDQGVLPDIITGTSGGALVAALVATRTDDELREILVPALAHKIRASQDRFPTWFKRWWTTGARFDSIDWAKACSWFTRGSMTFREAFERTGRILNVSCIPSDPHSPTILANYLTSPDCVIWSAVMASAAVPGILNPVVLMMKTRDGTLAPYSFGHKWKDGSLRTDIPIRALNLHFNVNFSIVSQVNPHINLFFFSSRGTVGRPVTHRRGRGWRGGFLGSAVEQFIKLDLTKWLKVLRHLELLPRPMGQDWSEIWLQKFSGTVTIWPRSIASDFIEILSDPSPQRLDRMLHVGQQSAFPKIQFITNRMKLEHLVVEGLKDASPAIHGNPVLTGRDRGISTSSETSDSENLLNRNGSTQFSNGTNGIAGLTNRRRRRPGSAPALSKSNSRGDVFEELRRQSSVFWDESDQENADGYEHEHEQDLDMATGSETEEQGGIVAGQAPEGGGTRIG